jgi:hypothetical protein
MMERVAAWHVARIFVCQWVVTMRKNARMCLLVENGQIHVALRTHIGWGDKPQFFETYYYV